MKTLFDKIWDAHVVNTLPDGPQQLYIDRHYCHEVTSPQAFDGLRSRNLPVFRPEKTTCAADHNVPTLFQERPIADPVSRHQIETLNRNAREFGLEYYGIGHPRNGVIHIIGPENGLTRPGMTIVCGDSHTSTHGAFGAVAFGIGTSEVEMVLASQCILQAKPRTMRINLEGSLPKGVTAKDAVLYLISQISTGGATGYFIEFAGNVIREMSMEGRMTVCNMSIEMGARGGMIAPDEKTLSYLEGRAFTPRGAAWNREKAFYKTLQSDPDAHFDKELTFDLSHLQPMVTFGTNPGMGIAVSQCIPSPDGSDGQAKASFLKSLAYMGFAPGEQMLGKRVDYVFLGSCTNGRIEDFRLFADYVRGKKKSPRVVCWLVPGSRAVEAQIREEGLDRILEAAGFELRQPGCSACLAMNEDKVPPGKYSLSTSNRNFEGRQGPGARTLLCGPLVAAAAAVTGVISNPVLNANNDCHDR